MPNNALTIFQTMTMLILIVATLGGIAYYGIALYAARKHHVSCNSNQGSQLPNILPPISLLKPLRGADAGLAQCLETFFLQDYPAYEILFAVRREDDPAVAVVRRLMSRYPHIAAQLIFTGEPPYSNAKVYSLKKMTEAAHHQILVITDSDSSVAPDYLQDIANTFAAPEVGAMTNLYRGISGDDLWSKLEAIGMSTEFMAGVVVAEMMEGMKFTLGPSMAIRTDCLRAIGGFAAMADYLADDFVLGNWADQAGYRVALSCHTINHHATAMGFLASFKHRLRWNRSTRRSRPQGYMGQGFTYGLSWAALFCLIFPSPWSLTALLVSLSARILLAWQLSRLLKDRSVLNRFWLIPLQDALSFASWLGGFTGKEIIWRNERYRLLAGGRFEPVKPRGTDLLTADCSPSSRHGITREHFNAEVQPSSTPRF